MTIEDNAVETLAYKGHTIIIQYDTDPENPRKEHDNVGTMVCFHGRYDLGDKHNFDDADELGWFLGANTVGKAPSKPSLTDLTDAPFTTNEIQLFEGLSHDWFEYRYRIGGVSLAYYAGAVADMPEQRRRVRQHLYQTNYELERREWEDRLTSKQYLDYPKFNGVWLPLYLYDHGGITISTGSFNDPWDSGCVGAIYADKATILGEWGNGSKRLTKAIREQAIKYLEGEVETYDQYLTGQVYGYRILVGNDEVDEGFDIENAAELDSCWGFFGEVDYVITEAKSSIDCITQEN